MAANARSIRGNERGGNVSRLCDERRELVWSADGPAALTERADQRGPPPARLDDLVQRPHPARALDRVDGVELRSDRRLCRARRPGQRALVLVARGGPRLGAARLGGPPD